MGTIASLIPASVAQGSLGNLITAIFRPARAIGPFSTQVTIEEHSVDELVITDHPISQNADISDHAYNRPPEVIIRCGFSNSSLAALVTIGQGLLQAVNGNGVGPLNYAQKTYQNLLMLQANRIPFSVTTGKRTYKNMLLKTLAVETDKETENVLMVTCHCRGVILVQTQIIAVVNSNNVMPTPTNPATTNPVVNTGTQNLTPSSPSPGGALPIIDTAST